ncbi:MarP family serine protease [Couchioplanes caeruleus]|uniref:Peptidase S1 n=2 Tax=Couchioplanes caeruleus TaxID=56438 RepID=A0A1K0FQ88_9ACTN|nr:MarP family serine protease [Couchioplanes caeruleus]OJF15005.1 peptidase S1 [Couchioplanes caeruleus subsp. caeruleus]ROP28914.1 colicin V production protein [Couchioplanes caeruleus]
MRAVDSILIVLVLVSAVAGYRQGLLFGALSLAGFSAGALLGVQAGPLVAGPFTGVPRVVVSLVTILVPAVLGQFLAARCGLRLRDAVRGHPLRRLDEAGGAVISALAMLVLAALVVVPLRASSPAWLDRELRGSALLAGVGELLPGPARALSADLARALDADGLPAVFHGLSRISAEQVDVPDPGLAGASIVAAARSSVVKVRATPGGGPHCARGTVGSGFVYARERVMTNAHVVSGAREVRVRNGRAELDATVVAFDPDRDVAVLHVPGLTSPILRFADKPVRSGADAVVLGFPLDGPYDAQPARIRSVGRVEGPDIYGAGAVDREMYAVRTVVRGGNSGGPLVAPGGQVLGVVFAVADEDPGTGFALTAAEISHVAELGAVRAQPVDTGPCRPR